MFVSLCKLRPLNSLGTGGEFSGISGSVWVAGILFLLHTEKSLAKKLSGGFPILFNHRFFQTPIAVSSWIRLVF